MDARSYKSMIRKLGDPSLREPCPDIASEEFSTGALKSLLSTLTAAMRESHGIGIAAPQIGTRKRIFLMEINNNPRYPDAPPLPLLTIINPKITTLTDELEEVYEGCLSLPGMRGPVKRVTKIRVDALDPSGLPQSFEFHGLFARVALHENDHLDGILYFDRIRRADQHRFGFQEALDLAGIDLSVNRGTPAKWTKL
jgi:peptide deformylase